MSTTDTEPHRCTSTTTTGQRCKRVDLIGRVIAIGKGEPPGTLCFIHWRQEQQRRIEAKAARLRAVQSRAAAKVAGVVAGDNQKDEAAK